VRVDRAEHLHQARRHERLEGQAWRLAAGHRGPGAICGTDRVFVLCKDVRRRGPWAVGLVSATAAAWGAAPTGLPPGLPQPEIHRVDPESRSTLRLLQGFFSKKMLGQLADFGSTL
jgi:hypothetical protein